MSEFGDISNRVGVFASKKLLEEGKKRMVFHRFALQRDIPLNAGTSIQFRRYKHLSVNVAPIQGNRTPSGEELQWTDVSATVQQFGKWVPIPKAVEDTIKDPVLTVAIDKLQYNLSLTCETLDYNIARLGTNAIYSQGATSRSEVAKPFSRSDLRAAIRTLRREDAMPITTIVTPTAHYSTSGIEESYIAVCHTDLEPDLRALSGFKTVAEYSDPAKALPGEFGSLDNCRFVTTNVALPFEGAGKYETGGANPQNVFQSTANSRANVYPILIFGQDAFATTKLAGSKEGMSAKVLVHNPRVSDSDPLQQRGSVGYIFWRTSLVLNNSYMVRIETACHNDQGIA